MGMWIEALWVVSFLIWLISGIMIIGSTISNDWGRQNLEDILVVATIGMIVFFATGVIYRIGKKDGLKDAQEVEDQENDS